MDEPIITINGVLLTSAQAMIMRVALQSFGSDLIDNGLGDDETGKEMTKNYLSRIGEINFICGFLE